MPGSSCIDTKMIPWTLHLYHPIHCLSLRNLGGIVSLPTAWSSDFSAENTFPSLLLHHEAGSQLRNRNTLCTLQTDLASPSCGPGNLKSQDACTCTPAHRVCAHACPPRDCEPFGVTSSLQSSACHMVGAYALTSPKLKAMITNIPSNEERMLCCYQE